MHERYASASLFAPASPQSSMDRYCKTSTRCPPPFFAEQRQRSFACRFREGSELKWSFTLASESLFAHNTSHRFQTMSFGGYEARVVEVMSTPTWPHNTSHRSRNLSTWWTSNLNSGSASASLFTTASTLDMYCTTEHR